MSCLSKICQRLFYLQNKLQTPQQSWLNRQLIWPFPGTYLLSSGHSGLLSVFQQAMFSLTSELGTCCPPRDQSWHFPHPLNLWLTYLAKGESANTLWGEALVYWHLSYLAALGIATLRPQNEGAQTSLMEDETPRGAGISCPSWSPLLPQANQPYNT